MRNRNKQNKGFMPIGQKQETPLLLNQSKQVEELVVSTRVNASINSSERERRETILRSIATRIQQDGEHTSRSYPDRARQFMPFAALKGYHELAYSREQISEPKRAMTEERAAELSKTISLLSKGSMVTVTHYEKNCYTTACGVVTEIDETFRILTIVKQQVKFDNIFSIEILIS